ncbi:hypothetical protein O3P69_004985 [Scylla paramamosain]|uniref:Uncharacterized protein n=1 Tax=Scylla paramamosain TaxID=85552 RepID=A0AAW0UAA1_SCYPA
MSSSESQNNNLLSMCSDRLWDVGWDQDESYFDCQYTLTHLYVMLDNRTIPDEFVSFFIASSIKTIPMEFYNQLQAKEITKMLTGKVTSLASSYCAHLQASHNQRMHALNGNPDFPSHMADIDKRPSEVKQFLEGISSLTPVRPINGEGLLGFLQGPRSLRDGFHLISSSILRDGKIQPNTDIPVPATTLYPRQLRPTCPGPVVNSASALPVSGMHLSPVQGRPMKFTSLGQAIKEQQHLLELEDSPEPDAVSLEGYLHSDLELLMRYETFGGMNLCLETWLLKLAALDSIMAHAVQPHSLPATIFSAFDTRTRPTVDQAKVSINDSPVFSEDVGGLATPMFPYHGGEGTLSFHLSTRTVPSGDFIFLPPRIITGDQNRTLRLVALFVLMVTEWPFGIFTIHQATTDDVGGNQGNQVFVPSAATFRIPGLRSVNIILPRDTFGDISTDQNSFNQAAAVCPQFGSAATGAGATVHPAHDPINICWDPSVQPIEYSLTQFLCSWALDFSLYDIIEMVGILKQCSVTDADMASALEILRMYTTFFPSLIESDDASETDFAPDSVGGMRVNVLNCTVLPTASYSNSVPQVVGGWPQASSPDTIVMGYDVNIIAFSRVMLGLMVSPTLCVSSPCCFGKATTIAEQILGAMQAAVCPQVCYALFGITSEGLTNASKYRGLNSSQHLVQKLFASSEPSQMGAFWEFLERKLTGYGHVGIVFNNTSISPYSRQYCRGRFSAVDRDTTAVNGTVPAIMVTAWLALFSNELPKSEAPFTSFHNHNIIAGYNTDQDPTLHPLTLDVNGVKSTAGYTTATDQLSFYSENQLPTDNLNSLYNIKLAQTEPAHRHYVRYCGRTIDGVVFPAANMFIKQRALPLLPGAVRPGQEADALVGSIPRMTTEGARVVICHDLLGVGRTLLLAENRRGTVQRASLRYQKY